MGLTVRWSGGWTPTPLSECDPQSALEDTAPLLDGHHWWIGAGTVLGLHRDGAFIPWDTDVDIGLEADWDNPPPDDLLPWPLIGAQYWDGRPTQLAYLHGRLPVDVYVYYRDGDRLVNRTNVGRLELPAELVDTLGTVAGWPAPSPVDGYLAWRYGPGWRVPTGRKTPWQFETVALNRETR